MIAKVIIHIVFGLERQRPPNIKVISDVHIKMLGRWKSNAYQLYSGEGVVKDDHLLSKLVQKWRLAFIVSIHRELEACIISYDDQQHIFLVSR